MKERLVHLRGADPTKVAVIHNWADCTKIMPGPKRNHFSVTHGLADRFVVMHSGNIGLSQGLEHVVEAGASLQALQDMQMVFVGDGVKRRALEAQVQILGLQKCAVPAIPAKGAVNGVVCRG
jgi:glycosyltransferase involved in cell wall biosynthesis